MSLLYPKLRCWLPFNRFPAIKKIYLILHVQLSNAEESNTSIRKDQNNCLSTLLREFRLDIGKEASLHTCLAVIGVKSLITSIVNQLADILPIRISLTNRCLKNNKLLLITNNLEGVILLIISLWEINSNIRAICTLNPDGIITTMRMDVNNRHSNECLWYGIRKNRCYTERIRVFRNCGMSPSQKIVHLYNGRWLRRASRTWGKVL